MDKLCTYRIEVRGQVNEEDLNAMSPLHMTVVRLGVLGEGPHGSTIFTIHADQSGLIGLLRHLHARGFVFLSVGRYL
jgi:hypothetical protein